jgi:hypothetical protein
MRKHNSDEKGVDFGARGECLTLLETVAGGEDCRQGPAIGAGHPLQAWRGRIMYIGGGVLGTILIVLLIVFLAKRV